MTGDTGNGPAGIVVRTADAGAGERAAALGRALGLPVLSAPPSRGVFLAIDPDGLGLCDAATPGSPPLRADFTGAEIDRRLHGGRRSALARALGLHRRPDQSVFDATCGLARDSAVLLGLGCEVRAAERHPVMRALIEDGVARAARENPARLQRWRGLVAGDAADWLAARPSPVADVVYLDPMFGHAGRRALPKQPMQTLDAVVGYDEDPERLLAIALTRAGRRVVAKRHRRAPELAPPDLRIDTRGARFDIYLCPEPPEAA